MRRFASFLLALMLVMSIGVSAFAATTPMFIAYTNTNPARYQIEVDITNQVVTVYEKSENGQYDSIVKQFICTTGASATPTPWGSFKMGDRRERFGYFTEFHVYAQYWSHVVGGIYFHSVLYSKKNEKTMTTSSYNNLGRRGSHGCIRLLVEDARWIYFNAPPGTTVKVVGDKPRDEALTKSLKPKVPAKKYVVPADPKYVDLPLVKARFTVNGVRVGPNTYKRGDEIYVRAIWWGNARISLQDGSYEKAVPSKYVYFDEGPVPYIFDMIRVDTNQAFMRQKASAKSRILACFGLGTEAEILGSTKFYYLVSINGKKGYILKSEVSSFRLTVPEGKNYTFSVTEIPLVVNNQVAAPGA